ncbi:MAG: isochorismatase [Opitutae bacterium]|nr:isochorismatase [Opitutae bacterium]MBG29987.1 isochorismatase [Opitutae bacterium]|tara:strand:- start:1040 stop:1657 length:618 start_codon:yes stop_codon:yes gene_type:complete
MKTRDPKTTALILIGYQNDYFSDDGILHGVIEEVERVNHVLDNTLSLIRGLAGSNALIISTPIIFTEDYSELQDPVGILKVVKDTKAFCANSKGSETIQAFNEFGDRIKEVPGKRGLNAFSNTQLDELLRQNEIKNIVFAGAVTSVCIDSSARAAYERGFKVSVLSDCTTGRTMIEQDFYCNDIFPIYAEVLDHVQLMESLTDAP